MIDISNPNNVIKYLLEKDYENKICVECKSPMPTHVSINNSVLLCTNCAEKHKQLGYNISYIRELNDDWDQYLLNFLERGGNSRYIRLCNQYDLNQMPIEEKLKTKILDYYRLLIKTEVLAEEPPKEIEKEYAKQPSDNDKIIFPEFENYEIFHGKNKPEPKKNFETLRNIGSTIGNAATYIKDKYNEYEINSKIKTGVNYVYNASKPIVQYASNKVVEGAGYLYNKISDNIKGNQNNNDKNNNQGNEKNEENNTIQINSDVQHSSLVFEKAEGIDNENENEIKIEEYPSLSAINNQIEKK
jgi:hypothetical protein